MTSTQAPLPVLLSASVPDEVAGTPQAQRVTDFVTAIVEALFSSGVHLVFGGHPTITPLVYHAARAHAGERPSITLFQLERFRGRTPPEVADGTVFGQIRWVGVSGLDIETDLANLREPMARLAEAAIFIGGKTAGFSGGKSGIRDEFERFRAHHVEGPVYLVGGAGGETARIIAESSGSDLEKNGTQGEARHVLHASHDAHIVAALIARDLGRWSHPPPP